MRKHIKYSFIEQIMTGAIVLLIGVWARLLVFAYESFYMVLLGSIIASFSQAFMANPVAKMAMTWFGDKEV